MTEKKPLELSFAKVHDIIQVPVNGRLTPLYVMSRCEHSGVAYYDEVSKSHYPNIGSLVTDLERGGRFHLAVRCEKHRWMERLSSEAIIALWPAISCDGGCGKSSHCGPGVAGWMCSDCTRAGVVL